MVKPRVRVRYFLDQDDSCHWYIVPVGNREEWMHWRDSDSEDDPPRWATPLNRPINMVTFEFPRLLP